jgi:hypothetical protein
MDNQPEFTVQRRRTPTEIEQIAAVFAGSGLTRTEFCRREHLGLGTLNRYLQRQHQEVDRGTTGDGLVSVEVADPKVGAHEPGCGLAVVLARGRRIEVGAGFDGATLERLVLLLENM